MSRFLSIVLCLFFSCSVAAAEPLFIILKPSQGPALLKQCSRQVPQHVSGFWSPELSQIQELEAALPAFLSSQAASKQLRPLTEFKRQYVGFIQNGKKYIYGNFYSFDLLKEGLSSTAVVVCDGGASFWGVVYSGEDSTFQDLSFNGVA
ncbi:MAG: hypothetical protein LBQ32_10010 [Burkholderiaceae bacterium]|jgi:hypothetical protein|nr:hypothetical protein [Burkholderiaceae bacterium]